MFSTGQTFVRCFCVSYLYCFYYHQDGGVTVNNTSDKTGPQTGTRSQYEAAPSRKGKWKKELAQEANEWVEMLGGRKKDGYTGAGYAQKKSRMDPGYQFGGILSPKESRSSLIGDFYLTSGRFELESLYIWNGIGDVVIDLSRALIQEEDAFLVVKGWVGDVTIYVPVDLPVSVSAEVTLGDLDVFGHRQGGVSRCVVMRSENFEQAPQKVNINISLLVGDIDVKYI